MSRTTKRVSALLLTAFLGMPMISAYAQTAPEKSGIESVIRAEDQIPKKFIDAVIQVESSGNPKAERYESHIDDSSYGLMQMLSKTARGLEKKYSDLPRLDLNNDNTITDLEVKNALFNPETNVRYGTRYLAENFQRYGTLELAVAAYNAGPQTPENALIQHQFNVLLNGYLKTDGAIGPLSKEVIEEFQEDNGLTVDGIPGKNTKTKLRECLKEKFPNKEFPAGLIPENGRTPYHVKKVMDIYRSKISTSSS